MYTYIHTYIHTSIHPSIHACMHACIHTYIHTLTYIYICICIYIYCRASHTGDACRGQGRERERGISSELADMTCCELNLAAELALWLESCRSGKQSNGGQRSLCSWYFFANPRKSSERRFLQTPKKRQIGAVFARFFMSRNKKHRKYRCFWLRASAKPRYLRRFEPLLVKIPLFTVFCGPGLAKTLVFTQFPACCQKLFLDAKGTISS